MKLMLLLKNNFIKIFFLLFNIFMMVSCKNESKAMQEPYHFAPGLPPELRKGINLSNWFNDYSYPGDFDKRFTTAHFARLKQLGFTYVRLPVGNTILFQPSNPAVLNSNNIAYVDSAVSMAVSQGLAVLINYHPWTEEYEKSLFSNPSKVNELMAYWQSLAGYLKKYNPHQIFFEVYNEPHAAQILNLPDQWGWWWPLQQKIILAIRAVAPEHYIVAGNEGWNNITYLSKSQPYPQEGIIYNFHFYEPFVFTHQGATWVGDTWKLLHDVPYPSSPQNVAPLISESNNNDVKNLLTWYGNYRYNADTLERMIKVAVDWGAKYNVPITCNEFGVYKNVAPATDRAQCIHDVRQILEKYNVGWAMWECDEGFGLFNYQGGDRSKIIVDDNIKTALGL